MIYFATLLLAASKVVFKTSLQISMSTTMEVI